MGARAPQRWPTRKHWSQQSDVSSPRQAADAEAERAPGPGSCGGLRRKNGGRMIEIFVCSGPRPRPRQRTGPWKTFQSGEERPATSPPSERSAEPEPKQEHELRALSKRKLRQHAAAIGIAASVIEETQAGQTPKADLIHLILANAELDDPVGPEPDASGRRDDGIFRMRAPRWCSTLRHPRPRWRRILPRRSLPSRRRIGARGSSRPSQRPSFPLSAACRCGSRPC